MLSAADIMLSATLELQTGDISRDTSVEMVNQICPRLYFAESILCLPCAEFKQTYLLVILCSHHLSAGQM